MSSADRHETTVLGTLPWDPQTIGIFIGHGYALPCVMAMLFRVFALHSLIESGLFSIPRAYQALLQLRVSNDQSRQCPFSR